MADPRRLPVLGALACVVVLGAALGSTGTTGSTGIGAQVPAVSQAPVSALSSSWFCAGARAEPGASDSGWLTFDNVGTSAVDATVRLVTPQGYAGTMGERVPAGGTLTVPERLINPPDGTPAHPKGTPGPWVGALVTLFGGKASVSQVVTTAHGSAAQPCASEAAGKWYFATGTTVRNARDEISLLNPYTVDAIADLSFTTDRGPAQPPADQGVVVPARGLAVLDLGAQAQLGLMQHVAVTVKARTGQIVAFETEIATTPPAGAPPLGTTGAVDAVVPVAGITLTLGATQASTDWWWPEGADGPGLNESYDVYNPGPRPARLSLILVSGGAAGGAGGSDQLTVGAYGTAVVPTNGQPWALPDISYSTELESTNGVPVVAERSLAAAAPSPYRGLGALLGQAQAAKTWLLGTDPTLSARPSLAQVWLEVSDPGLFPASVSVEGISATGPVELPGTRSFEVAAGQRAGLQLPIAVLGRATVVTSSVPILLEEDSYSMLPKVGMNLAPAVELSSAQA